MLSRIDRDSKPLSSGAGLGRCEAQRLMNLGWQLVIFLPGHDFDRRQHPGFVERKVVMEIERSIAMKRSAGDRSFDGGVAIRIESRVRRVDQPSYVGAVVQRKT